MRIAYFGFSVCWGLGLAVLTSFAISGIVLAALIYGIFVIKKFFHDTATTEIYTDKQLKAMEASKA